MPESAVKTETIRMQHTQEILSCSPHLHVPVTKRDWQPTEEFNRERGAFERSNTARMSWSAVAKSDHCLVAASSLLRIPVRVRRDRFEGGQTRDRVRMLYQWSMEDGHMSFAVALRAFFNRGEGAGKTQDGVRAQCAMRLEHCREALFALLPDFPE